MDLNIQKIPVLVVENSDIFLNEKLKNISEKNKIINLAKMRKILIDGVMNQIVYEDCSDSQDNFKIVEEGKIEFFDI